MKHLFLAVALAGAMATTASASVLYDYSTSAMYTASGADPGTADTSSTCTGNTVNGISASYCVDWATTTSNTEYVLAYAAVTQSGTALTAPTGTNDTFGYFQLFCYDTSTTGNTPGSNCGDATMTGDFTITVSQTVPAVFSSTFTDAVLGNFTGDSAGAMTIDFTGTTFTYPGGTNTLVYTLEEPTVPTPGYGINIVGPPTSDTSIQGNIESTPLGNSGTPEPATLAMIGGGLSLLGLISRRKRA
jgi:PEP-CTERM motif